MTSGSILSRPRQWCTSYVDTWDRFWFTPRLPHTIGLLRILTGAMLLYGHLVLATELTSFLGDSAWINNDTARQLHDGAYGLTDLGRSYLWYLSNPALLWGHHLLTIVITAAFMVGLLTRITGPAAWFLQLMYIHRLTGALFGLDQIVTYTAMYLMFAPCGSVFSVDAWIRKRLGSKLNENRRLQWLFPERRPTVSANIATRLLQLHLCVIYLFGGLAKARGESWWDGTAVWYAVANLEYQSIDMTWLASYPRIFSALSHITLFWEVFYCALIWPRFSRPIVLAIAIGVHGGIALFLGMATFGLMMIAANIVFVEPEWLFSWRKQEVEDDIAESGLEPEIPPSTKPATLESVDALVSEPIAYQGITDQDVIARAEKIDQAAEQVRIKHAKLKERHEKMKERERKYKARVKRLKKREVKVKSFIERRRRAKQARDDKKEAGTEP